MTDPIAERVRKLGGTTLRRSATSRACSACRQRRRLRDAARHARRAARGQQDARARLRAAHDLCDEHRDVATASLIESGSTRPSGARGSCSNRAAGEKRLASKWQGDCLRSTPGAPYPEMRSSALRI